MKSIIAALALTASVVSANAQPIDVADQDSIQTFVREVYPRIVAFNPAQDPEALRERVRFFASQQDFDSFIADRSEDGTLGLVYERGALVLDEIVSKVSVYDRKGGDWKAEFTAIHRTFSEEAETAECMTVSVELVELPLSPGSLAAGITTISAKPARVKCGGE